LFHPPNKWKTMLRHEPDSRANDIIKEVMRSTLAELSVRLGVPVENAQIQQAIQDAALELSYGTHDGATVVLMRAAQSIGIRLAPVNLSGRDAWEVLLENMAVAVFLPSPNNPTGWVFSSPVLRRLDSAKIAFSGTQTETISKSQLLRTFKSFETPIVFVAEPTLVCHSITSSSHSNSDNEQRVTNDSGHDHDHHAPHEHLTPQRRMLQFLKFESRDIWSLAIFGFVVAVLDLATPLAVEQMVTTIGFASLTQPLVWLAILLFGILSLSAIIKGLQIFVVEILQRRMFVRIVGDLSERLPRLQRCAMDGIHGPEMANRFFDVMTIQKATAGLLVEGLSLIIQTLTGLLLLALYSPFLLAFDIVLIMAMTILLYLLGRNAVRTAIDESLVKYRVAHWLQDVIGNPTAFQVHGAGELVVDRANRLTVEYLEARRAHFVVLMRQTMFALILYAVSISSLMSLGVWLVISESLSMGQLVASVSVVIVVVGAFSKIGKSLESFYDLMSAMDKVGHLIDLPALQPSRSLDAGIGPVEVRARSLLLNAGAHGIPIEDFRVASGQRFAVVGEGECGKTMLLHTLCGLRNPTSGYIEIGGIDSREVNRFADGSMVSFAGAIEIFRGTLAENISLNRHSVGQAEIREALITVELWEEALTLPRGLETMLQSGGYPLSETQLLRLVLARAIATRPRLLLIDGVLDRLPPTMRMKVWEKLSHPSNPWTTILTTNDPQLIEDCDSSMNLENLTSRH
jgi:putative ABC transport system ATP-binding protein